jgi:hypothetical protein
MALLKVSLRLYAFARDFFGNLLDDCEGSPTKLFQRRRDGRAAESGEKAVGAKFMKRVAVDTHGWGDAQVSDIEAVLMSTLECFKNCTGMTIAVDIRVLSNEKRMPKSRCIFLRARIGLESRD